MAVLGHGGPGRRGGVGLLLGQFVGKVGLSDFGGDGLKDAAAQHLQRLGVVMSRMPEQEILSLRDHGGIEQVLRQRLDRVGDHTGLVRQHLALCHRRAHCVMVVQLAGEPGLAVRLDPSLVRGVSPPGRGRGGTRTLTDPATVRVGRDPQLELCHPRGGSGQLDQHVPGLAIAHRPCRLVDQTIEKAVDLHDSLSDGVAPVHGARCRTHGMNSSRQHRHFRHK